MTATWLDTTLGDIAEITSGATPKTAVEEYWDGGIPWATPKDLSKLDGTFIESTPRTLSGAGLKSCAAKLLPAESVLLSSRAPIGLVAINSVPMATNQGFKSLVPDRTRVNPNFLYWWLRCHRPRLEALGNGATFKEVSKRIVAAVRIQLPPLEEQRRIAAVLDAADALRVMRREALARLDDLIQSIFVDMFGATTASTHTKVPFGSLLLKPLRNGISPSRTGMVIAEVLTLSAITGPTFGHDARKRSTFKQEHREDRTVSQDDFLICRGNGNLALVGRGKHPDRGMPGVAFPDTMIAASCDPELISRAYLTHIWHDRAIRTQIEGLARTTNGTHKINQTTISSILVPLPSIDRQREFEEAERTVAAIREHQLSAARRSDELLASLQQRAFRGEL